MLATDACAVLGGASAGVATTMAGAGALSAAAEEGSGVSAAFGEGGFVATDGDAGAGVCAAPLDTRSVVAAAGEFLVAAVAAGLAGVVLAVELRWFQVLRTSGAAAGASLPSAEGFPAIGVRGSRGAEEARIVPYIVTERGLPVPSMGPRVSGEFGAAGV